MKIVLKTTADNTKSSDKPTENKEKKENEPLKSNKNSLKLAFGDKTDDASDENKEVDGKHILSRNKSIRSKDPPDLFTKKKPSLKNFSSLDESISDSSLDPQLYLYDEFVSDKDKDEPKKLKYLGFVDDSTKGSDEDHPVDLKESRYMSKMVSVAKKRQMERDIALEKQLLREELKSDSNIGEVFVTGAYKKKLEERKRFEEEQRKKDEYDEVHSKNSLTKLHTYLLNTGLAKRSTANSSK